MMDFLLDSQIWLIFSFLIFCGILWKYGAAALTGMLDKRITDIRKEIQTAEDLRVEAQELLAQYQRKHKDAISEAETIVKNAEKQAGEIRKQAEQDLKDDIARRAKHLTERLERMEESALAEIREHAANLAMDATAAIISAQMDKKAGDNLVDESIDSLKSAAKNIH